LKPPNFLTILCNIDAHFADLKLFRAKILKSQQLIPQPPKDLSLTCPRDRVTDFFRNFQILGYKKVAAPACHHLI
jgi:hypothetical protein